MTVSNRVASGPWSPPWIGVALVVIATLGPMGVARAESRVTHQTFPTAAGKPDHSSAISSSRAKPLVAVFGDSLVTQAASTLVANMPNAHIEQYSYPGVAACFYVNTVARYVTTHKPRVAIVEFWGNDNAQTPCVNKYPFESAGYFAQYRADVASMTRHLVNDGAHVFLVGTVPNSSAVATKDSQWDHLNDIYAALAHSYTRHVVTFLNIQQTVEDKGRFTWYLPCLPTESSCDAPVSDVVAAPPSGNNVVRSREGLHFCPLIPSTSNYWYNFVACDAYSSGTYRYAQFISTAIERYLHSDSRPRFVGPTLPVPGSPESGVPGQVDPYTGAVYPTT